MSTWLTTGAGATAATGIGLIALLAWLLRVIVVSDRRATAESKRATAEVERVSAAHIAELARLNRDHDDELVELRRELREIRDARKADAATFQLQIDSLNFRLDAERDARRTAEDQWRGGTHEQ